MLEVRIPTYEFCRTLFSSVQSLSRVRLCATPWTPARQASLSITNSQSLPKPVSIELVMPSNHLIFCHPLLLLPSIFPSIRVFSNESALLIRWLKYWSFSLISFLSKALSKVFPSKGNGINSLAKTSDSQCWQYIKWPLRLLKREMQPAYTYWIF